MLANIVKYIKNFFGLENDQKKQEQGIDVPVAKAEEQIRLLKNDLVEGLRHLAEVKAIYIRMRKENDSENNRAKEYENKARLLLLRASDGQISQTEADNLALQALAKKDEIIRKLQKSESNLELQKNVVSKMEENTRKLKEQISEWEMELKSLKARAKISEANKRLNQKLAGLDTQNTAALMQDMRDKVTEQELLADAYLNQNRSSLDDEIDRVLGLDKPNQQALEKLKAEDAEKKLAELNLKSELERLKKELDKDE